MKLINPTVDDLIPMLVITRLVPGGVRRAFKGIYVHVSKIVHRPGSSPIAPDKLRMGQSGQGLGCGE